MAHVGQESSFGHRSAHSVISGLVQFFVLFDELLLRANTLHHLATNVEERQPHDAKVQKQQGQTRGLGTGGRGFPLLKALVEQSILLLLHPFDDRGDFQLLLALAIGSRFVLGRRHPAIGDGAHGDTKVFQFGLVQQIEPLDAGLLFRAIGGQQLNSVYSGKNIFARFGVFVSIQLGCRENVIAEQI